MNTKEINFAYKVRHALNEQIDNLPAITTERLAAARNIALSSKKAEGPLRALAQQTSFAGSISGLINDRLSWFARMGMVIPIVVAAAGIFVIYQSETQQRISDVAEIDAMVLADELPLNAYLDKGFNGYLARRAE